MIQIVIIGNILVLFYSKLSDINILLYFYNFHPAIFTVEIKAEFIVS